MTDYVLLFVFDSTRENILGIRRTKKDWQEGRLNVLGGKIEKNETDWEAAIRELEEEAGIYLDWSHWRYFGKLSFQWGNLFCYTVTLPEGTKKVDITHPEGHVQMFHVEQFLKDQTTIGNLKWLVPAAMDDNYIINARFDPHEG